jgi:hypothetical protein
LLRLKALSRHPKAFAADVELTAAETAEVWAERIAGYDASHSAAIQQPSASPNAMIPWWG